MVGREARALVAFYFFYFCALGAFMPYWGPWLKSAGQGALAIGILTAAVQFSKVLGPNLWGWLAQGLGSAHIVPLAALLTAAGFLALELVHGNFWGLLLITLTFSFFWAATLPLVDAATLDWAERNGRAYGRIRLWGSLGFIALALGMGGLVQIWGLGVFLPGIAAFLAAAWWFSRRLPYPPRAPSQERVSLGPQLRDWRLWAFLAAGALEQASHGVYYAFFSIDAQAHGLNAGWVGLLWSWAVICEVVFFWYGERILRRFGLRRVLIHAFVLTGTRWLVIAAWPGLIPIFLIQSLHAFSYAAFHLAAVHWIFARFPMRLRSRGMALYASLVYGLGGGLGALAAGWAWGHWGSVGAFAAAGILAWLGLVGLLPALRPLKSGVAAII
ncbi:MAG: MFS transporter [Acidithiobacillus sp.]